MKYYWTQAETIRLERLVNSRMPIKKIALLLGKTFAAVQAKKARMNLKKPAKLSPKNPLHVAEVLKFKMAGWKNKDIAEVYECRPALISWVLTQNGFIGFMRAKRNFEAENYERWDEIDLARIRKFCKRKYSLNEIYPLFPNRSIRTIRERVKRITRYWS